MDHYNFDASVKEEIDSLTESSRTIKGDKSSYVSSPTLDNDAYVALPTMATTALLNPHPPPVNHSLPTE